MPRILSIQSHVVSGYVGNKAATFPLQLLDFDVDAINTVQFSNHTGFNVWKGERTDPQTVLELFEGLRLNGLDDYSHLLTGYMGNADSINVTRTILDQLRAKNPEIFYVLDPVLGDDGNLYVPEEMIPLYRTQLLPLANLVTPNQFEIELLTETKISNKADAQKAMDIIHNLGVPNVVITSCDLGEYSPDTDRKRLHLFGSQRCPSSNPDDPEPVYRRFQIDFPKLDGYFTGTGDLFCALLLARLTGPQAAVPISSPDSLARACEMAIATMAAVMRRTLQAQQIAGVVYQPNLPRSQRPSSLVRHCELQLIKSKKDIGEPVVEYRAMTLE
ncbi:putative pyridoxal kinase [Dimargaris cristalligena]|uniref:pyridoxal kinase n=1 Tax=Dimargaris cristalligena TaxID=215637 RepID=A0A4Q0A1M8_9FUNG|nr:putative pyridoxal kinase [Dimargaris cristalligena]RKP39688.1 Ribokinase-like protein [Dimargaris cristalligena]|eukprot:RKP39688.1 Ribokinase-like protein [Dimargaris cristalligena]